jgi:hypothetical protein
MEWIEGQSERALVVKEYFGWYICDVGTLTNDDTTGRKEIASFFYLYTLLTICSLVIDCGVVPPGSEAYPYFVAVQCGLASSTCICLMINGFVGFQLYEDGTTLSVWLLRVCSLTMFVISFVIALLTFKSWAGLSPESTVGLFVVVYIFSAIFLFVYIVMQIMLVVGTLQERWPLWHIGFGVAAFVIGQILLYAFSETICSNVQHYMDGLFFATLLNLLAVMMVYKVCIKPSTHALTLILTCSKFWDAITQEDLEFSVGQRPNNWEVKDHLLSHDDSDINMRRNTFYDNSDFTASTYYQPQHRNSTYGGGY